MNQIYRNLATFLKNKGVSPERAEELVKMEVAKRLQVMKSRSQKEYPIDKGVSEYKGCAKYKKTGEALTDALTDIKWGVPVEQVSEEYSISIDRLEKLSGKKATTLPEDDLFSKIHEEPEEKAELTFQEKQAQWLDENPQHVLEKWDRMPLDPDRPILEQLEEEMMLGEEGDHRAKQLHQKLTQNPKALEILDRKI